MPGGVAGDPRDYLGPLCRFTRVSRSWRNCELPVPTPSRNRAGDSLSAIGLLEHDFDCPRPPVAGRGWATIDKAGKMKGMLYFHDGDETAFTAEKSEAPVVREPRLLPRRRRW